MRVGLDRGGTKIQAVAIRRGATVIGSARRDTPHRGGPEAVIAALADSAREVVATAGATLAEVSGVGVGSPGAIDKAAGTIAQVANIDDWDGPFPLGPMLAAELGRPVTIGNDVNVAVDAERRYGAGREFRSFLGVFWGTGVGGGIVIDGKLLLGRGSAGEIGHVCARPDGRRCNCGLRGCVEAYAGRGALEERARKRKTLLFELQRKRGRDRLTSGIWARALEREDKLAVELMDEAIVALGAGVASVQNVLDVDAIVIGGGLGIRLGEPYANRILDAMMPHLFVDSDPPVVQVAALGDLGGAIGASLLLNDPA